MSRIWIDLTENITIYTGNDHAIGEFLDITDKRFAGTETDEQGEGYVLEHSQAFGLTTNKIGAIESDLMPLNKEIIISKCDEFINKLNQLN